ncbi:transporter substrate-binding domain-containing protein [uncultured Algibacter sp.]|uniref:hybrid sensor histidine kinase/response regulator n=1 Tax=uncultured Algibacter sp. TaxID=298659 RepID=UPI00321644FA
MKYKTAKIFFLLALCFIIISFFSCSNNKLLNNKELEYLKQNKTLSVGICINYPPYGFLNKNGEIDGVLIDYFKLIEDNIDYKFELKLYPNFQDLLADGKVGRVDVILDIQDTPERRAFFNFTPPIIKGNHSIYTQKNSNLENIKDLNGKKVAVGKNFSIQEYLEKNYPEIILVPLINENACLKALANNETDAYIGLETITSYYIKKEAHTNIELKGAVNYENKLGIAIKKSNPILSHIVNKGNSAISSSEKDDILNKWLYDFIKPVNEKVPFWQKLFFLFVIISIISFLLNYILKREIIKRTQQLNNAKIAAEKGNELKTLLFQNISHEVRTPLNSIIAFSSFLSEAETNEEKKEYTNTILKECANLTNILNSVIDIADLNTQQSTPRNNVIALDRELKLLADVYSAQAHRKKLSFIFNNQINADNNFIYTDKSRFNKSISYLLDNAIKFTNEGGSISLNCKTDNNTLIIDIEDTGIGIKPQKINKIFKEFYQVEKKLTKKYAGLGIGLSIAYKNIKSLGGEIIAKNNTDKSGAVFTIKIPVNFAKEKHSHIQPIKNNFRILITEDMKLNYLVLEKTLNKIIIDDIEIAWAKNGQEAIDMLTKDNFDVVFMDIKMPVLDGFEATKIIKKKHPKLIVIAQTAYTQEEDFNTAITIGFDSYITKPIDPNTLKMTLQDFFKLKINADD